MSNFLIEDGILIRCDGSMEKVVIPEGVKSIGEWTFWNDGKLGSVVIPESVGSIDYGAFYGCSRLTEIVIPQSVKTIGAEAFAYCGRLRRIEILSPDCCIKDSAFKDCCETADFYAPMEILHGEQQKRRAALTYLRHPEKFGDEKNVSDIKNYILAEKKGLLPWIFREDLVCALSFLAENGKLEKDNFNEDYIDPATAAGAKGSIAFLLDWKNASFSFDDEERLFELELNKDFYSEDDMKKFWDWEILEDGSVCLCAYKGQEDEVFIPERIGSRAVSALGERLFFGSEKLKTVDIPSCVRKIGADAFRNCRCLKAVNGLEYVSTIGDAAFRGCLSLERVALSGELKELGAYVFSSCNGLKSAALPEGLQKIGDHAFSWTRLSEALVPESVGEIGSGAFAYCVNLKTAVLPQKLKSLGAYAFRGCTGLTRVNVPTSVGSVPEGLFTNCEALEAASLEEGLVVLGRSAFSGCSSLRKLIIPASVEEIESDAFSRSGLRSLVIPAHVKKIGRLAFAACKFLERVEIQGEIRELAYGMFLNCPKLAELSVPEGTEVTGEAVFNGCPDVTVSQKFMV